METRRLERTHVLGLLGRPCADKEEAEEVTPSLGLTLWCGKEGLGSGAFLFTERK